MHSLRIRLLIWSAVPLLGLFPAEANDYYVSPSGSDSAPGTLTQPFVTIQHAASVMVAGDTAHIRAGVYRETVRPANSGTQSAPITYMPYNSESVTVSGADVIPASSWTLSSGNIYKAPMAWDLGAGANQVFLDGQMMIEAQWPNTTLDVSHPTVAHTSRGSYVDGGTGLSTGTISDPNLPSRSPGYWNGATLNICLGPCYSWQTGSVTDSSVPEQITFTWPSAGSSIVPGPNNSYFLTGKLGELDGPDEWFRDTGTSNLFFWTPLGDSPSGHLVEAKARQFAFDLSGLSFITIQGLDLFAATVNSNPTSQYLRLDGLQCQYLSHVPIPLGVKPSMANAVEVETGIVLRGSNNVLSNSTVAFSSGSGVYLEGSGGRIFNNAIHDTDYRPTYASPIYAAGANPGKPLIAYNSIYNSGRFGIYQYQAFGAGRILHNEIYDYGLQTNDLGCTYTYENDGMGTEIAYNLCHDAQGLLLNNSIPYTEGIYLDNGSSNFVVHHNVVWNVEFAMSPNSPSTNEQIYNNDLIGVSNSITAYPDFDLPGTVIQNNIFVGPFASPLTGAVVSNNILPGTDPQFVDAANNNYQLLPTSPAIAAGLVIPPYTNGYSGSAPDIGAYDHTKPPWKAGVQNAATVSAPTYAPTLTPGTLAVVTGSAPFDSGVSVLLTDGANVDWPVSLVYVFSSPPQLAFEVPAGAAPGVAIIAITDGDGAISLSSAPLFAGAPPVSITATQGSGQSTIVDTLFPTALQATLENANGTPVPDAAVTFTAPASGASAGFALSATVTTNAAGVGVAPAFVANSLVGTYTVTASAAGVGSLATFKLTNTAQLSQTITFGPLNNVTFGASPFTLAATASSQLTVTFTSTTSAVCTVANTTVSIVGGGTCSITATQAGNATFGPATPVTRSFTVNAASGGPAIAQGGIVPIYSSSTTIQPGSWISIFGTNLASAPVTWTGNFPINLGGVTVTINGKSAYLCYVSPMQINLQAPDDNTTGSVAVTVTNAVGSWTSTVTLEPISPSFSLLDSKHVAGIILRPNGSGAYAGGTYDILGPTGTSLGYPTVAAKAGDTVELYGVGFGPTTPPVPAGQPLSSPAVTTNTVQLTIGGTAVVPLGAGMGSAGLYQVNVTIPGGLRTGDQALLATVGGVQTQSGVVISLQ